MKIPNLWEFLSLRLDCYRVATATIVKYISTSDGRHYKNMNFYKIFIRFYKSILNRYGHRVQNQ